MKRVTFKKEFKSAEDALTKIPNVLKEDKNVFELNDKNKIYKVRWEGTLTEGKGVVLISKDEKLINEDMNHMKHLMGYTSEDTLGKLKGSERINENLKFNELMSKKKA